jgi:1-acyl-sn-glycerol-3-phosphate acyltransferase
MATTALPLLADPLVLNLSITSHCHPPPPRACAPHLLSDAQVVVVKDTWRHIPGIGWAMQLLRYIFVRGNWATDEERISYAVRSLQRDGPCAVLHFPEGSDLSKTNLATSHQFAKDRDLPLLDNVLVPRTRGFVHLFNLMKAASEPLAIWDVTVGYVGFPGGSGESEFLSGAWPSRVHYRISRWPSEQIPADKKALALWIKERWAEKEHLLDDYGDCDGAHMMLPAESSQPSSPVDAADPKAMLLPSVTTSPFPWHAWTHR